MWLRSLATHALLFSLPVMAASAPCWHPYVEGSGYAGDYWWGGGLTGFLPLCCSPCGLAFVQGDVMDVDREGWVAIGGGYRRFVSCDLALGLAGFFDYAHTHRRIHHSYYQGTIAGEAYYRCFEFRANGYLANRNTNEKIYPTGEVVIDGIEVVSLVNTVNQSPYSGFDLLAGYNLELSCNRRLRGWADYYDYTAHHAHNLRGARIRAQAEVDDIFQWKGSRFVVGGIWQYDQHRKHQASLILSLRIALGRQSECCRCCCSSICRCLGDPVMRRPGILVRERENRDQAGSTLGQIVFFQEGATGIGTQADPTNLQNALNITNPGDVLFGLANGGDIDVGTVSGSTLALQDRQQLWGFDSTTTVTIIIDDHDFEISELAPAGRPRLVVPGGATDTVTLANRNIVDGLAIEGSAPSDGGDNGIVGMPSHNTTIRNMTIDNTVANGIMLAAGSTNTVINNANVTNPGTDGILANTTTNTQMSNITIDAAGSNGISADAAINTQMSNITIDAIGSSGIAVISGSTDTIISNAEITNPGTDGILIVGVTNTQASNLTIDTTSMNGIMLQDSMTTQISDAMLTNVSGSGLRLIDDHDLVATNIMIDLPGNIGIHATGTNENFTFDDCLIAQNFDDSLMLLDTITGLEVTDSMFTHSGTLNTDMIIVVGPGDYTFTGCDITKEMNAFTEGQLLLNVQNADGDLTVSNCVFDNAVSVGTAIAVETENSTGTRTYTLQNISMTNIDGFGIDFVSNNGNDDTCMVSGCSYIGNDFGIGYRFINESTATLDVVLCENTTIDQRDGYFFTTGSGNTGIMNVLMDGNASANSQDSGVLIIQGGNGAGTLNATVNNHEDLNSNLLASTNAAYQFQQNSSDFLCVTIQDCSSNTINNQGIFYIFDTGGGPIQAFPSDTPPDLAAANPGINGGAASIVFDPGVALAPAACATPNTTCPAP